jgi:hypothetical protein
MASLAGRMSEFREVIFGILGETLINGSHEHKGRFFNRYREIEFADGSFAALEISFECQKSDDLLALTENEQVTVEGNTYRFIRRLPDQGDESGKLIIELGTVAP